MTKTEYECAIIGGGPAGCAAAIYAGRSGVDAIMFDDGMHGIVAEAPTIENYPGIRSIQGIELADTMHKHANEYVTIKNGDVVETVREAIPNQLFEVITAEGAYRAKTIIIATGTKHRTLGVDGEAEFKGRGVSYCATCDGFFFKGRSVVVIGGGSAAVMEALYLNSLGANVSIIHRRDQLRAEEFLCRQCEMLEIPVIWDTVVDAIEGDQAVEQLRLRSTTDDTVETLAVDGVFISIGIIPRTELAEQLGVELDTYGYILTDRNMRTNVRGVYAAGDVIGGVRQIITACAEGATAALNSLTVLGKQYPY